ncbi:MAG: hypothetical protein AAF493_26490, partial [Pseudomonadota bacterium]
MTLLELVLHTAVKTDFPRTTPRVFSATTARVESLDQNSEFLAIVAFFSASLSLSYDADAVSKRPF